MLTNIAIPDLGGKMAAQTAWGKICKSPPLSHISLQLSQKPALIEHIRGLNHPGKHISGCNFAIELLK
jgi:hypothetical protein